MSVEKVTATTITSASEGAKMIDEATVKAIVDRLTCPICLEPAIEAFAPPCRHYTCTYCLDKWTVLYRRKTCAICRQSLHNSTRCSDIDVILEYFDAIYKQKKNEIIATRKRQYLVEYRAEKIKRRKRLRQRLRQRSNPWLSRRRNNMQNDNNLAQARGTDDRTTGGASSTSTGMAYNFLKRILQFCCRITNNEYVEGPDSNEFACQFELPFGQELALSLSNPGGRFRFEYVWFRQ